MRVLVTGGRDFSDRQYAWQVLNLAHLKRPITIVIEGGAAGADAMGRSWANKHGIEVATCDADWELYRGRAGLVRNAKMLREHHPQLVIAFKGGRGTAHMVRISLEAGIPVLQSWLYKDAISEARLAV